MTKTQISCFIAVATEGSFTRAANALYISQPAISKSIAKLEEELGFPLFERTGNALKLTAHGERIYDFLTRASSEFESIVRDIQEQINDPAVSISVGCPETWNPSFFHKRILSQFMEPDAPVKLSVVSYKLSELITRLQNGQIDVGLSHLFYNSNVPGITSRRLTGSGCGIIYSKEHFNATALSDFKDTDFLLFDINIEKRFAGIIKELCKEYGFTPRIKNISSLTSALFDVACGKGVMFFSDWDSAAANTSYGFLRLPAQIPIMVLYKEGAKNGMVNKLVDDLVRSFKDT